jgi:outer membrane protein OmpA-like peptidoglycan-associated protein
MSGPGRIGVYETDRGSLQALLFNFDVNVHLLKPEHRAWINANVGVGGMVFKGQAASVGTTQLLICGLASRTGSNAFNWNLAKNRAFSVAAAIRARNVQDLKPVIQFGVGEEAARLAGLKDGVEDEKWRGVMLRFDAATKTYSAPTPNPYLSAS